MSQHIFDFQIKFLTPSALGRRIYNDRFLINLGRRMLRGAATHISIDMFGVKTTDTEVTCLFDERLALRTFTQRPTVSTTLPSCAFALVPLLFELLVLGFRLTLFCAAEALSALDPMTTLAIDLNGVRQPGHKEFPACCTCVMHSWQNK